MNESWKTDYRRTSNRASDGTPLANVSLSSKGFASIYIRFAFFSFSAISNNELVIFLAILKEERNRTKNTKKLAKLNFLCDLINREADRRIDNLLGGK